MKINKLKNKRIALKGLSLLMAISLSLTLFAGNGKTAISGEAKQTQLKDITKLSTTIKNDITQYLDENVAYKLPDGVSDNQEISVIVSMNVDSVLDAYEDSGSSLAVSDYILTRDATNAINKIETQRKALLKKLSASGLRYSVGEKYNTVLSGFEIEIAAKDFSKVGKLIGDSSELIIGDEYERAVTEVVTNEVDVYDTGIFDSSSLEPLGYQGDGVVVAVLDTGLDYTHSAFSVNNFTSKDKRFTLSSVSDRVSKTRAAAFTSGLTGEDVYLNEKVPYAYDYADKDSDVLPINSEHGTHVAGIIAGKDDTITGVAPNAQLAIMKVFSDAQQGAKTSWILAAVEDCVVLGVDVINMSLGSSCGFTREVDKQNVEAAYDKVKAAGISLITAASNDYNATMGSEKNGNNGRTTNPDSGTVGSPSTYDAALSVASVDGVKTPYFLYGNDIIYFNESTNSAAKKKDFVGEVLKMVGDVDSYDFEYVTIPGIGRSSDYAQDKSYYEGKIVLVKRGQTTFEDKIRVALKEKGAAGVIIYNNVSGTISMSVGADVGAACSISQDEGEKLAAHATGTIRISKSQKAGPFMSDFSSWGPTSDLRIKPEITAHGGEILSAIPGQDYDRLSGTSMASPNLAGATALIRQYVKADANAERFGLAGFKKESTEYNIRVTALVNQLMMSTADIIMNKNGLPYAVRKQGAGLVNLLNSVTSASFITTYDRDTDKAMDKSKLELKDDKERTGVYTATFDINNVSGSSVTYDLSTIIQTEGVSETYTTHGDTVVTQEGYLLSGTTFEVKNVENGSKNGTSVSIAANSVAKVTVEIRLSDEDKAYLERSFKYGMYVEGFIRFKATAGTTVNLNLPLLSFYGDWTEAPIFDEEYYDTNVDEVNAGLDDKDKLMADAFATRVIGGLYSDYIMTMGVYPFTQNPSAGKIAANKDKIAMSLPTSLDDDEGSSITKIRSISAGLLRNVGTATVTIVEDSTGREVFSQVIRNQRKSMHGGSTIYGSSMDIDFSALEKNLKNNTKYTVTVKTYIDYGDNAEQKNARNTFEFPLYIDFQAPTVTDVTFRTEYDKTTKKTKLFADFDIYDNHYAMAVQVGQIVAAEPGSRYTYAMNSFSKYLTPVYSSYNSTSKVSIEITDYVEDIKKSMGPKFDEEGNYTVETNNDSFVVTCYDYAFNSASYQIRLPDEILAMNFSEEEISLDLNETLRVSEILSVYPSESWIETLDFEIGDNDIASIVNGTIIAKKKGTTTLTAKGKNSDGKTVQAQCTIIVTGEDKGYSIPTVNKFTVTGYETLKAYYNVSSDEREIGETGSKRAFGNEKTLSMFPSESVKLEYTLDSYFEGRTKVVFESGDPKVADITEDGRIIAYEKGETTVFATVYFDGEMTFYSDQINITVKDPFTTNSIYLMNYRGLGGTVEIPADRGITTIYSYAFSGYEYVDKDLSAGDVIDDEDPYYIKQQYIGEDTITKIVIPEGVVEIQSYAFAGLTALKEVVLPSTLTRIGTYAFYKCEKLTQINLENVKFINEKAFFDCAIKTITLSKINAIGNYSFANSYDIAAKGGGNKLDKVVLPESSQSLGIGAFSNNISLKTVTFDAPKIKIGSNVFEGCTSLTSMTINAAVISSNAFKGCSALSNVTLGKDVAVIGEYAFAGTKVSQFKLASGSVFTTENNGKNLLNKNNELVLVAPKYNSFTLNTGATAILKGAVSGNAGIKTVVAPAVKSVGEYAFAGCTQLATISFGKLTSVGDYAFHGTALATAPDLTEVKYIGKGSFAKTKITEVNIGSGTTIGDYAFSNIAELKKVTLGDNVTVGRSAFESDVDFSQTYENLVAYYQKLGYSVNPDKVFAAAYKSYEYNVTDESGNVVEKSYYFRYDIDNKSASNLTEVVIGKGANIGNYAFAGNILLARVELGEGAAVGNYAFYNDVALTEIDLSQTESVGAYAFSGTEVQEYKRENNEYSKAYNKIYADGEVKTLGLKTSVYAAAIENADLSNATALGVGAFKGNEKLVSVVFGGGITAVPAHAFEGCSALEENGLNSLIASVGAYAYVGAPDTSLDLSSVKTIGEYAFAYGKLEQVTFGNGVAVGAGAFVGNYKLAAIENADGITSIGKYAFAESAIEKIDLANVVSIGDFAFENSELSEVKFGDKLKELGENPFAGTNIATFGKLTDVMYNGKKVGEKLLETYDVSETVKVIDGVLYSKISTGLELVSYPKNKKGGYYNVEEGTVRISAKAFEGSQIASVSLPTTLLAIGDKAFFGAEKLSTVIFKGYNAPILEEEYDAAYANGDNVPYGKLYGGLGITDYYMWNVVSGISNYYYGATFVNYIGKIEKDMTMVKPANGKGYDTLIFSLYFGRITEGSNALTSDTIEVIGLIGALPSNLTLADEAQVVGARTAYNALILEQQALVSNYASLQNAENIIEYLKQRQNPSDSSDSGSESTSEEISGSNNNENRNGCGGVGYAIGGICAAVILVGIAVVVVYFVKKKK